MGRGAAWGIWEGWVRAELGRVGVQSEKRESSTPQKQQQTRGEEDPTGRRLQAVCWGAKGEKKAGFGESVFQTYRTSWR